MIRALIGLAIAFAIGAVCRIFEIPVPAPPKIFGAVLVVAITVGYMLTDTLIARRGARETAEVLAERPAP